MIDLKDTKDFHDLLQIMGEMQKKYNIPYRQIVSELLQEEMIPVSAFCKELSPLQTLVVFLREKEYTFEHIGKLLNRDARTVWQAFQDADVKKIIAQPTSYFIPVTVFKDRTYSILESVVAHLVEVHHLSYSETARQIDRDPRTVWTVYKRLEKKRGDAA